MASKYSGDDDDDDVKTEYFSESKTSRKTKIAKEDKAKGERISDEELLDKVQKYFYEDKNFGRSFELFVEKECGIINLQSTECSLEYTEVYERYKALFEDQMESFIESLGCAVADFYNALKRKMSEDSRGGYAIFGEILVSVTDFEIFVLMMIEAAKMRKAKLSLK